MEFVQLKFKTLKFILSLITCALIAWPVAVNSDINWVIAFLFLAIGLPLLVWLNRLKNIPAHLLSAYLMNKGFITETKKRLRKLPLKTADEWNDFQSFYDDQAITKYVESDPKAFAVSTRYSIQTLRDCGNFMDFMNSGLVCSRAIEQIYWEVADKENSNS